MTRTKRLKKATSPNQETTERPKVQQDVNFVNGLRPYDELKAIFASETGLRNWYKDRYGILEARKLLNAALTDPKRVREPIEVCRHLYVKPYHKLTKLDPSRKQELYGYSFEAQASAAELVAGKSMPFSFKAVCDMISEGLEYQTSLMLAWQEDPELFGQTLADALSNMEQLHWPRRFRPQSFGRPEIGKSWSPALIQEQYVDLILTCWISLVFWLELDACVQRLRSLGMPERGLKALDAVKKPSNIRDEYLTLCSILQNLECTTCHELFNGWVRGRGGRYIYFQGDADIKELRDMKFVLDGPMWTIAARNHLDAALADFALSVDDAARSTVPERYTGLFLEIAMKEEPDAATLSQHITRLLNPAISVNTLKHAVMRAFKPDVDKPPVTDTICHRPRETWSTTFTERYGKFMAMDNFARTLPGQGGVLHLSFDRNHQGGDLPLRGFGDQFKKFSKALEAEFGRLDEYFLPAKILQQQPYWKPDIPPPTETHLRPISNESYTQSGHSYRRETGLLTELSGTDVKPVPVTVSDPNVSDRTLVACQSGNDTAPVASQTKFQVNSRLYTVAKHLLGVEDKTEAPGHLRWDSIVSLLRHVGFTVLPTGGSMRRFIPPNNAGRLFVEHAPHPEPSFDRIRYRAFGKRLQRLYGWAVDWFVTSPEEQAVQYGNCYL